MSFNLLEGYVTRTELADELQVSPRTIINYERQPDGLPWSLIGGKKRYKIESVQKWLADQEVKPNPRRAASR